MTCWDSYNLPEFRIGKNRTQPSPYITSQPLVGPLYVEQITDDIPVQWDVTITCDRVQASQFQAFLQVVDYSGAFQKSILTEFGFVEHEVRIVSGIPSPVQVSHGVWEYSFTIYALQLEQPDAVTCNPDLWLMYGSDASLIDLTANEFWPA